MTTKWTLQQIATIKGRPFYELRDPSGKVNGSGFVAALIPELRRLGDQVDSLKPRKEGAGALELGARRTLPGGKP